jgi:DNA-binding NarL/FixJ family response regulator
MTEKSKKTELEQDKITVAVLEDNATLMKGIMIELDKPDISVCIACDNIDQFLAELKHCQPRIAIVDLRIWKDLDAGFIAITEARTLSADTEFIVHTAYDVLEQFHKGINLGVRAFVSKNIYEKPLDEVVRIVYGGGTYYGDFLTDYLDKIRESSNGRNPFAEEDKPAQPMGLSKKELEILDLLDKDLSEKQIAANLVLSINTIKAHTKSIRGKLCVKSTKEAVRVYRLKRAELQSG